MDLEIIKPYLVPATVLVFLAWRFYKTRQVRNLLPALLSDGAVVVDVRSRSEFAGGARPGSLNIPLDELESRVDQLDHQVPMVLCCATGARSARAMAILKRHGFLEVWNAGSWKNTID